MAGHIKLLLSRHNDRTVALQLLQTISILSHNINTKASRSNVYTVYFHANNFLNEVISFPFDFEDEEIAENFVVWLKGLATCLTADMMQYYFTKGTCPILLQAQRFYAYHEPMTRTAARTVALCLFRTKHPEIIRLALESGFFSHLVCHFRQQWMEIDQMISAASMENMAKVQMALDEQSDNLYYLNDLCDIEHPALLNVLGEELLHYLLFPLICGSLGPYTGHKTALTIQLAEYMFVQTVTILRHSAVINGLAAALFMKEISPSLVEICLGEMPPAPPAFAYTYRPHDFVAPRSPRHKDSPQWNALKEAVKVVGWAQGTEDLSERVTNPIRSEVLSFLRSKDDNLIVITGIMLQTLLTSPDVHKSVLSASGLLPPLPSPSDALEEPKETSQVSAGSEVLEHLLELLGIDPPFRMTTTKLICQLVLALTVQPAVQLGAMHLKLLAKAQVFSIKRVKTLMKKSFYSDLFLDFFEEEWSAVRQLDLGVQAVCHAYYLLPMFEDVYSSLPLAERLPLGEIETARRDTHVFFLLLKLRSLLHTGSNFDDFSVLPSSRTEWEEGESYAMDDREFTRCVLKQGHDQFIRYFAEDPLYFILVTPDQNRTHYAAVSTLTSLRNVEAMIDRADPRVLVLAIKSLSAPQLILGFDSPLLCHKVKKTIDDHRKQAKERGLRRAEELLERLEGS